MNNLTVLWVDDEIESLKSLILFLEKKDVTVLTSTNGYDALEILAEQAIDVVLLDESMPGMTGLETLAEIKDRQPSLPVIMITKNEEEYIMEEAIGSQITDYLIKPVNPNQVWLSLKKQFDTKRLVSEHTNMAYQQDFRKMFMAFNENPDAQQWMKIYSDITEWEYKLSKNTELEMYDVITNQKKEANTEFYKFFARNYLDWVANPADSPLLSPDVLRERVFPDISTDTKTLLLVMDNLRYDQWYILREVMQELYTVDKEEMYYAIIPTTTQYARNALFSGLMPMEIVERYPAEWSYDDEEGGKNNSEVQYLTDNLKRNNVDVDFDYTKVTNYSVAKKLDDHPFNFIKKPLNVIVYNFVDMLSHARSEMEVLKELASDDFAYRALTLSWFKHSVLYSFLKQIKDQDIRIVLTTDHGSIQVKNAKKVKGNKMMTNNLRYKHGKSMVYNDKEVFEVKNPYDAKLPRPEVNSSYIFAKEDEYLCYPNNFGKYSRLYKNTYQHGGISIEEILVPLITLSPKS